MNLVEIRRGNLYIGLYLVAVFMFALPLLELLVAAMPPRFSSIQWRFGLVGLFGNGFLTPMWGLTLLALTAAVFEHRIMLRLVATTALLVAVIALSGQIIFALDVLQLRATVRPQAQRMYDFATVKSMVGLLGAMLVSSWIGVAGWKASLSSDRGRRAAEAKGAKTPVLIATASAPAPRPAEALEKAGV